MSLLFFARKATATPPPPPPPPPPPEPGSQFVALGIHDVRISWNKAATNQGWFVLGESLLGGPDLLAPGSQLVPQFDGPYDNVTAYLADAGWSYGRSATLEEVQQGKWKATIRDPDGRFNPNNPASPLYGMTNQPGRAVRHRARTATGDWQPQFFGFLRTLEYEPTSRGRGLVHLEADDLFVRLDVPAPVMPPMAGTTTGGIVGALLDAVGWSDPDYRRLAVGDPVAFWPGLADGSSTVLQLISEVLAVELGLFYVDPAGVAVYEDRNARALIADAAVISQEMRTLAPGMSLDKIGNKATSTKTDSTPQTYTDAGSADPIFGFGPRELPTVDSPLFQSDAFALAHARYRVNRKKDPVGDIWSLQIDNRTDELLDQVLGLRLSQRVQADEAVTGGGFDGHIERVERTVTAHPYRDTGNYLLSARSDRELFILGSSLLGSTDVLAL
jgi:hypothetical protein